MDVLMDTLIRLGVVLLLVFANGFFVATEFALVSVRRTRIDQLVNEGNQAARPVQRALDHLNDYISATQLGITMASLALGWVGEPALAHLIEPVVYLWPAPVAAATAYTLSVAVAFATITFLHIVLGELAPKTVALQRAETTALVVAWPVTLFLRLFWPAIWLLNTTGNRVVRLLGISPAGGHESVHSEEELKMLMASSEQAGVLEESEKQLLYRVFDFTDLTARQVMVPRPEIVAVPVTATLDEVVSQIERGGHSRLPVYEGSLDNIIGLIYGKDLIGCLRRPPECFNLRETMRPVLSVPMNKPLNDLLAEMRTNKSSLVILIDEFGGTAGLVTIKDILEELVGQISDEDDRREEPLRAIDRDAVLVDAHIPLATLNQRLNLNLPEGEYETLAGFLLTQLDRIPVVGDEWRQGDLVITIKEMKRLGIRQVLIRQPGLVKR